MNFQDLVDEIDELRRALTHADPATAMRVQALLALAQGPYHSLYSTRVWYPIRPASELQTSWVAPSRCCIVESIINEAAGLDAEIALDHTVVSSGAAGVVSGGLLLLVVDAGRTVNVHLRNIGAVAVQPRRIAHIGFRIK